MTAKNAIYLVVLLLGIFLVMRFLKFLTQDKLPKPFKAKTLPASAFPICQSSSETEGIKLIQQSLNKTKKTFFTPYLEEDGLFGGATEWELKNQTQSICVSQSLYLSMT